MKRASFEHSLLIRSDVTSALKLLTDILHYPRWCPIVLQADKLKSASNFLLRVRSGWLGSTRTIQLELSSVTPTVIHGRLLQDPGRQAETRIQLAEQAGGISLTAWTELHAADLLFHEVLDGFHAAYGQFFTHARRALEKRPNP